MDRHVASSKSLETELAGYLEEYENRTRTFPLL